jgi:hypothetical protein
MADRRTEILLGAAAFAVGALLLRDAFDGRGRKQPWWLRAARGLA